jgi:hypothetical protein
MWGSCTSKKVQVDLVTPMVSDRYLVASAKFNIFLSEDFRNYATNVGTSTVDSYPRQKDQILKTMMKVARVCIPYVYWMETMGHGVRS